MLLIVLFSIGIIRHKMRDAAEVPEHLSEHSGEKISMRVRFRDVPEELASQMEAGDAFVVQGEKLAVISEVNRTPVRRPRYDIATGEWETLEDNFYSDVTAEIETPAWIDRTAGFKLGQTIDFQTEKMLLPAKIISIDEPAQEMPEAVGKSLLLILNFKNVPDFIVTKLKSGTYGIGISGHLEILVEEILNKRASATRKILAQSDMSSRRHDVLSGMMNFYGDRFFNVKLRVRAWLKEKDGNYFYRDEKIYPGKTYNFHFRRFDLPGRLIELVKTY